LINETKLSWQGSAKILDVSQARMWAPWFVAEYRLRNMSKWLGAIVAFGLGNPLLYLLSVGIGIGALVDNTVGADNPIGVPYLTFLAPALLATAAIQAAMDETTFPTMQGFIWDKSFFSMISTQLTARDIVGGIMIASSIRCSFNTLIYAGVLVLFGAIPIASVPVLVFAAIFAGISFAAVMLAVTSFVKNDDGFFAIIGRFVLTPMFMFSGTFYPLESLPIYLQWVGWISPVWHSTNLGRNLSYSLEVAPWLLAVHVIFMAGLLLLAMFVATRKFSSRLSA
jgi:lipooligosaccharide transport system permease protein